MFFWGVFFLCFLVLKISILQMQRFASQRQVARLLRVPSFLEESRRVCSLAPKTALLYRHTGEITVMDAIREDSMIHFRANHSRLRPVKRRADVCRLCATRLLTSCHRKHAPCSSWSREFASALVAPVVPTAASRGGFAPLVLSE